MKQTSALEIDRPMFMMAFGRDVNYPDIYPQSTWLDLDTGDVIWVYEYDDDASSAGFSSEENCYWHKCIETEPKRYLEIPGLDHGDHHKFSNDS